MRRPEAALASITRRLPTGFRLPSEFARFVKLTAGQDMGRFGHFQIKWTNPSRLLPINKGATANLIPFLRLGDGGFVGFWIDGKGQARIVHADSEGECRVIAAEFSDFMVRVAKQRTQVPDIDDAPEPIDALVRKAEALKRIPPALQKEYSAWLSSHSVSPELQVNQDASRVRQRAVQAARQMIKDRLYKDYTLRDYWSVELQITRSKAGFGAVYLDQGEWLELAAKYVEAFDLPALVARAKHPNRKQYKVFVSQWGLVSLDDERELVLVP